MTRKEFIQQSLIAGAGVLSLPLALQAMPDNGSIMTVKGPINAKQMGFTLSHEHILVDFIGADKYSADRYNAEEVYNVALPFLKDAKTKGCKTFIDCTPSYLGRDPKLLKRLAQATGLYILCPTGYYGAVKEKYIPAHAYNETAQQLADRWIGEFKKGIEGTDVKPGFIKTSVDNAPLSEIQVRLIEAAALTHLATGLTIAVHTGNGEAANEELRILKSKGVAPSARIWVHAQNESDMKFHIDTAKQEGWVAFDGVNPESMDKHLELAINMKKQNLLNYVLIAEDSGWYNVGDPNGGKFNDYTCILTKFIPLMKENGFTQPEIDKLFIINPAKAFALKVRKV